MKKLLVINNNVVRLNALYAKNTTRLSHSDIDKLHQLIIKKLVKNNIFFLSPYVYEDTYVTFMRHQMILTPDEVILVTEVNEKEINRINSIYDQKVKDIIDEAREEYAEKNLSQKEDVHSRKK